MGMEVQLSNDEEALIEKAAKQKGMTVEEYLAQCGRNHLEQAARNIQGNGRGRAQYDRRSKNRWN